MRISELSATSGLSVATIRYCIQEGFLAPGDSSGPQRADDGGEHLARLRLLPALIEIDGVGSAGAERIAAVLDRGDPPALGFEVPQDVVPANADSATPASPESAERIRALVGETVCGRPAAVISARALDALGVGGGAMTPAWLESYAESASLVAHDDLDELEARTSVSGQPLRAKPLEFCLVIAVYPVALARRSGAAR